MLKDGGEPAVSVPANIDRKHVEALRCGVSNIESCRSVSCSSVFLIPEFSKLLSRIIDYSLLVM